MRTRLTESWNISLPIISAPMALVSGGRLAAAVSAAGGLGLVGGGYAGVLGGEPDLKAELDLAVKLLSDNSLAKERRAVGVGFITWALARRPALLEQALAAEPAAIFLSFGDPLPFAQRIHQAGAKLICQVQTLRHLEEAVGAGAAMVVAQGTEAGGHGGRRATLPFVPEAADYLAAKSPETLLAAAGGIADGRGLAAALALGADGVVMGTRFWTAEEALTPDEAVRRGLAASGDDTVRTSAIDAVRGLPWPDEFSFRMVRNALTDEWAGREAEAKSRFGCEAERYAAARTRLDFDVMAVVAGEGIGMVRHRAPAATILAETVAEARSAAAALSRATR